MVVAAGAAALIGLGFIGMTTSVLQEIGRHHSVRPLAARLNGLLRSGDILVHDRGLEKGDGLLFCTGHQVLVLDWRQGDLEFGCRVCQSRRTFIDMRTFLDRWEGDRRVFLVLGLLIQRSAVSKIPGPHLRPLASTGLRRLYVNRPPATVGLALNPPSFTGTR